MTGLATGSPVIKMILKPFIFLFCQLGYPAVVLMAGA